MNSGRSINKLFCVLFLFSLPYCSIIHSQSVPETDIESIVLDLETALEFTLTHNTDLQRAIIEIQSLQITVDNAERQYHPSVSLSGSASSQWSDTGFENGWNDPSESASLRLSSSYTVFDGFSRKSELNASRAGLKSTEWSGFRTAETAIYQVVSQFLDTAAAKALIRVQEENLLAQEKLLQKIEAFYDSGKQPVADLFQQQAETAAAEYRLITVNRDLELMKMALVEKIGITPGSSITIISDSTSDLISKLKIPEDPETAIIRAKKNRSDYVAGKAELLSARESLRAAEGGYWPNVSLNLDTGTSYNSTALGSFGNQFGSDNPYATLGLSISLPIYNRHQTRNTVAGSRLQVQRIELTQQDLDHQIVNEINTAYLEFTAARKQLQSAETQMVYTHQALENYEQRYAVHAATLLEVVQARARHLDAAYDKIDAENNLLKKQVALAYYQGDIGVLVKNVNLSAAIHEHEVDK
jgi:outer membrane protein